MEEIEESISVEMILEGVSIKGLTKNTIEIPYIKAVKLLQSLNAMFDALSAMEIEESEHSHDSNRIG